MSLTATRTRRNSNSRYQTPATLAQELADRGLQWDGRSLLRMDNDRDWEVTQDDLDAIGRLRSAYGWDDTLESRIAEVLRGKSRGAVWIAEEYRSGGSIEDATFKLRTIRRINRAVRNVDGLVWADASATKLFELGIRHPQEAVRFMRGYWKFSNLSRPWGSCYQVDFRVLNAAVNADVNYQKLPDWTLKTLVQIGYNFAADRPGNIWRLVDCAKAWKWCAKLPKRIAERIGKMSVKARMMAPIAWEMCGEWVSEGSYEVFWLRLQSLLKMNLAEILDLLFQKREEGRDALMSWDRLRWGRRNLSALMNEYLGLPQGLLNLDKKCNLEDCLNQIAEHGDAKTIVNTIFKCSGKATIAAFKNAKTDAWKYARYLAVGDADLLQKYFSITDCLPFYPEAIEFLQSLDSRVALRMVQTLTYKVRGVEKSVEDYLVKDTGMMFQNLKGDRNLGRVRCWLSAHEELARRFIEQQPNEALPVHKDFLPIDGLSEIDQSWELVMPKSTIDLKRWGNVLSHCVGGYGEYVKSGRSVIVGVFVGGEVKYTIEMQPIQVSIGLWACNQFYGLRNFSPESDFQDAILGEITKSLSK